MEKLFNHFSIWAGIVGGITANLLGGFDDLLYSLLVLVVLDYITGICKAVYNKELSSHKGFKGLLGKIIIFIVVACSVIITRLTGDVIPLRETTIVFFISNELISILENAAEFTALPPCIKDILLQLRSKNQQKEGDQWKN